jgi:glycosyltransferase involved in cell wall biosynthesis
VNYDGSIVPLSVIVLTFNEQLNIERCLKSVRGWAAEVFVVDSFSTDDTEVIAKRYTDHIYRNRFRTHAQQWGWALRSLPLTFDWVLALDADFAPTVELKSSIRRAVTNQESDLVGYYLRHVHVFRGRLIRHGGVYPSYQLRLFKRDKVFLDEHDFVDQHFYVSGRVGRLDGDLVEDNLKERDLAFWVRKQVDIAEATAREELFRRQGGRVSPFTPSLLGGHNERVLWLKLIWARLPRYYRSVFYFLYRYVLRLGFLDGKEGLLYHLSQALLYRILADARVEELEQAARDDGHAPEPTQGGAEEVR